MEDETVVTDDSNTEDYADEVVIEEDSIEDVRTQLETERLARQKAEENYNNQKIRAEKAEKGNKNKTAETSKGLSQSDLIAVLKANVSQDDIEEVAEYASLKKISVADALKSNVVKAILQEKEEIRKTSEASNVGNARRVSSQVSDESLIEKARNGDFPDSESDLKRMIRSRKGIK